MTQQLDLFTSAAPATSRSPSDSPACESQPGSQVGAPSVRGAAAHLPALPYAGRPPSNKTSTSKAAAEALLPKAKAWQRRVLLALYDFPLLSDEGLERYLHCEATRTSRPRRRELELAGYIEDSGARCIGVGGTNVIMWRLTPKGEALAKELRRTE